MNYRQRLNQLKTIHEQTLLQVEKEEEELEQLTATVEEIKEALEVAQVVAQSIQQSVHQKIAGVVSDCLEAVFDEPYEFDITFERKRNRTEAALSFKRNGLVIEDPMAGAGGGTIDVAAFALRLACLTLTKGEQVLIFDEPFRFVSKEYRPRIQALLQNLAKAFDIQIIMVTHMDALQCGKVVSL